MWSSGFSYFLRGGVTHTSEYQNSPPILTPSRLQESNQGTDFSHTNRMARLFGLSPEQKPFLVKMIQNFLQCYLQENVWAELGNLPHLPAASVIPLKAATPLLARLSCQAGNFTAKDVSMRNVHTSDSWELPAVWLIATCLSFIWEDRLARKRSTLDRIRAELLARVSLLRSTRWKHYSLHSCCWMNLWICTL